MHKVTSICILLILSCAIIASPEARSSVIGEADQDLFWYIHRDMRNGFLDKTTPYIQKIMGDGRYHAAICLALCAFGDEEKAETGTLATVAFAEAGIAAKLIKCIVGRSRPLNEQAMDSFPSGHTSIAFAMATVVGNRHPGLRIPVYAIALGTAFSRVYRGHHYPSDVIVGAVIGILAGLHVIHYREPILRFSF